MKTKKFLIKIPLLFILSVFLFHIQLDAQTTIGLYEWKEVLEMQYSNISGQKKGAIILSKINQKFRVIGSNTDGKAIIMILDYGKDNPNFMIYNFTGSIAQLDSLEKHKLDSKQYGKYQAFFLVSNEYISDQNLCVKAYKEKGSLTIGMVTLPYKFRPQKGSSEFEGSFNFGASIGYKFPKIGFDDLSYALVFGVHHTSIKLDSVAVKQNAVNLLKTNNYSGLSFSLGFMVEYQKIQVGLFVGIDKLNRNNQAYYQWEYQNKPWISLAFGTSTFSSTTKKASLVDEFQ